MKLIGSKRAVRSVEFHRKQEFYRKIRFGFFTLFVIALLVGPVFLIRSKNLLISSVSIVGNEVTETSDIQKLVIDKLDGYYLKLFPKSSVALYPKNEIEKSLLESIPRLASANVSLSGTKSIKVEVAERAPFALYCSDSCFFMDDTGYIYSEAPTFSSGVYTIYSSKPKLDIPLRTQFFSQNDLISISTFLKNIESLGFKTKAVTKKDDEYSATLSAGAELRWRINQNLEKLFADLNSFMNESKLKISDLERLLYLDLRFDNKIFYKFVGE
ncbi:MAG: hypothetical protein AAB660_01095 [Patescibacteria group bacterium]